MRPETVLRRAAKLIEKGWCKGAFATLADGTKVEWDTKGAKCFCADGALRRAAGSSSSIVYRDARILLCRIINPMHLWTWNDEAKRRSIIIRAMERAAKLAEQERKEARRNYQKVKP